VSRSRATALIGLLIVIALFCAPLFIGLGGLDLASDEAIYTYAVDRILETGEWLTPRTIPTDGPFLEKPPLKFWMVAAAIRAGILPHDEVGYRFLDALMGAIAFLYMYAIGLRIAGPVCGVVAVFVTFSIDAILFEHGLRSNNMEAPLFLAYCGGVYHFMRWVDGRRARLHALGVAVFFVLGFMTKFVAALFLPLVCLIACVIVPLARERFMTRWRDWIAPIVVAAVLIVPWFAYESSMFGRYFWRVILGDHVVTRFTVALDVAHLQPWHFYFTQLWEELVGSQAISAIGVAMLALSAWRADPWQMRLLLIWWIVPFALMSLGKSKLIHYAFPFVPPIALSAGWVAARIIAAAQGPLADWLVNRIRRHVSTGTRLRARLIGATLIALAVAAIGLAIASALVGQVELRVGGVRVLQNSTVARPLVIAALLLGIAGRITMSLETIAVLVVTLMLPVLAYPGQLRFATAVDARLRTIRACAEGVGESNPSAMRGIFNTARPLPSHSLYYYLFRLGQWLEADTPEAGALQRRLFEDGQQTMVLMTLDGYAQLRRHAVEKTIPSLPPAVVIEQVAVVMPGPYSACAGVAKEAGAQAPRPGN
jgi:4-amino-4-deoxy-L-arabinose transferase-like glycosyltransferase